MLKYATTNNKANCAKLVEAGGLKHLFPLLMGRGLPKSCSRDADEKTEAEHSCVATLAQLCTHLHDVSEKDCCARLLLKFVENDGEKLVRCVDLFGAYHKSLQETDRKIAATVRALEADDDDEDLEVYNASIPSLASQSIFFQKFT